MMLRIAAVFTLVLAMAACTPEQTPVAQNPSTAAGQVEQGQAAVAPAGAAYDGPKVDLEFYIMSQCPFGTQIMNGISPVLTKLGPAINFSVNFIGQVQGDSLTSMHGENEVKGDTVQLCIMKHLPENFTYMKTIDCINKNMKAIPGNWEECAKQAAVPEDKFALIKACYEGQEGKDLTVESFNKAQAKGARGSPTIYLAGKQYQGGREEMDFMRSICKEFPSDKQPKACADVPPPVKFAAIIVADERCKDPRTCNTDRLEQMLKMTFAGVELKKVDWKSDEAKALYKDEGLKFLPAVLMENAVQEEKSGFQRFQRMMQPSKSGKYMVLAMGAKHDPTAEICDNQVDDTGDGTVDCADPTCKNSMLCREEKPGKVELFIMSKCPFGVKALDAMKEVIKAFGSEISFEVHFIGQVQNDKPTSMHGDAEVKGDIVELCLQKTLPEKYKFMDVIWCMNENWQQGIPDNWEACATKVEVPADKIAAVKACYTDGSGEKALVEDMGIATGLGIGGSPTWVANGRHQFSGIDPKAIQTGICAKNPGFAGCKADLPGAPPRQPGAAPAGGGCGG